MAPRGCSSGEHMCRSEDRRALAQSYHEIVPNSLLSGDVPVPGVQAPVFVLSPGAIRLSAAAPRCAADDVAEDVPGVPGARLLRGALGEDVCNNIVDLAEAIGFNSEPATTQDRLRNLAAALRGQPAPMAGLDRVRPPRLTCVADVVTNAALFDSVRSLLPSMCLGGALRGLNCRWRIYRYAPGNAFRPHLDDVYEESCLVCDGTTLDGSCAAVSGGRCSCRLTTRPDVRSSGTLMVYLMGTPSGGGGYTRFWVPNAACEDFDFQDVAPTKGAALFFFHGDHPLSLVHEGLPVLLCDGGSGGRGDHESGGREGAKYVLRTDVLYEVVGENSPAALSERRQAAERWPHILAGRLLWEGLQACHRAGILDGHTGADVDNIALGGAGRLEVAPTPSVSPMVTQLEAPEWVKVD